MSTIDNDTFGKLVTGTDDNDSIANNHLKVTISAGAGNDTISNVRLFWADNNGVYKYGRGGDSVSIDGGAGNDSISNAGDNVTIRGGDGNDIIDNWAEAHLYNVTQFAGRYTYIDGGNGNDSITSFFTNYVTLSGGNGDDTIDNYSSVSKVYGGAGNDLICGYSGAHVTIEAGAGNDSISLGSDAVNNLIQYKSGEGNDIVYGFNETSTLRIGDGKGTYSTVERGEDIIVTVGKGKITLVGAVDLDEFHIDGAQVLTLTNTASSLVTADSAIKYVSASKRTKAIKITGNALANSIVGGTKNDTLYGGYGADTLSGGSGADSLSGGAGKDTARGGTGNDSIAGGTGNDKLYGDTGNDTLIGGVGNDSLWGGDGSDTFVYKEGDDKDYIFGFEDNDTLRLDGLEFTATYSKKSKAVTLKFDDGSIVLKNFTATTFHIDNDTYKISGTKLVKQ